MHRTILATFLVTLSGVSSAGIFTQPPPLGTERGPTKAISYDVLPIEGDNVVEVNIDGVFSHNILGEIPPNEVRTIDIAAAIGVPGQPVLVTGVGWDVVIDSFAPSWMSDAGIAYGDDPTYVNPELVVIPALGSDFPGFQPFESGGLIDLTNLPGSGDVSFELSSGLLYMEFFERFDDFGNGPSPDAVWSPGSRLLIQAIAIPEPDCLYGWTLIVAALVLRIRRRKLAA